MWGSFAVPVTWAFRVALPVSSGIFVGGDEGCNAACKIAASEVTSRRSVVLASTSSAEFPCRRELSIPLMVNFVLDVCRCESVKAIVFFGAL